MPRYMKIILSAFLSLVLVAALAVVVLATFNWNHARPWVARQASELAQRPIEIKGDLTVDWNRPGTERGWRRLVPWPHITVQGLSVGNPEWSTADRTMAEVSRVSALINPLALLNHTVQLAELNVEEADLLLIRQSDGKANWMLEPKEKDPAPSKWKFDLQKVTLKRVRAQVTDAPSKLDLKTELDTLQETGADGYGIGWKASGTYNDAKIKGEGKAGGILSLREGDNPFPLMGSVDFGTTTIGLEGSVTRPQALAALDVRLKLAGETMADLYPILGITLPNTPPYSTEGRLVGMLEGNDDTWRYEDFTGVVGESDLQGTLEYQLREPRSFLTGELKSKQLRLQDLGPLIGADTSDVKGKNDKENKQKQPSDKALPVASISTKSWGAMDADVKFTGQRIVRDKALPLDDIQTHVVLKDRVLSFTPLNFGMAGGTLSNTLKLDGRESKIKAELTTAARKLQLKKLFPAAESMDASFGEVHGDAKLSAQGSSIAELLASSNGEIKALVSRGTISQFLLEAAGLNVANMILVKIFGDEQIVLNCLASDFAVKDGVMNVRAFRLETEDAVVDVTGHIDLGKERLDLDIRPANKTVRIFTLRSPLYAKGSFKNPDIGVQTGALAARAGTAVALGVLATPFAALLPLLNVGTDDSSNCTYLVAAAKKDPKAPIPGQSKQDTQSTENAKEKAADEKKDTRTEREKWPSSQPKP